MSTTGATFQDTIKLAQDARILFESTEVVRVRTGIWNFEEAIIDYSEEPPEIADTIRSAFESLASGREIDLETVALHLDQTRRASVLQLFSDLLQSGLLVDTATQSQEAMIFSALMGRIGDYNLSKFDEIRGGIDPVTAPAVIMSDSERAHEEALRLADQLNMPMRSLEPAMVDALHAGDLTTGIDNYSSDMLSKMLENALEDAGAVLCVFCRPSVGFLRNLNRVVERLQKVLIVGLIDGPFLSIIGTRSPYTGCFECFELRSLSRLEDHILYHKFAMGSKEPNSFAKDSPLAGLLTNLVVTEGFLEQHAGAFRFAGRVLNIFLPTLEIQVQDLLRMPGCPACGYISKQQILDINYNTREALDRIAASALG